MSQQTLCEGRSVLITGACGTIGTEMLRQALNQGAARVVALDHSENGVFHISQDYHDEDRVMPIVGNVGDLNSVRSAMDDVDIVFHGAALKHVYLGEQFPNEIVQTNIIGVQNIIAAAQEHNVERVTFMSSDKAVNPTNVMGTSKLMGERIITAASARSNKFKTIFSSTRFGNVLGSRGSVLPVFMKQIANGNPITLTDDDMTRFVMTRDQAVELVFKATSLAEGGEVFVTKMPVMRIRDMVTALTRIYAPKVGRDPADVQVKVIGKRPGEKLFEELLSGEEVGRAFEVEDYFVVQPALMAKQRSFSGKQAESEYRSDHETVMTVDEIAAYLEEHQLLEQAEA